MSDEEHEVSYQDHEMLEEFVSIKSEEPKPKKPKGEIRYIRQKFCPRWQIEFPWLRPDHVDESVGYCTICNRELVCKKSHLERHQRSFKHRRLQGFENVYTVNEPEAELIEAHTSGYLENENDYEFEEIFEDVEDGCTTIKEESTKTSDITPIIVKKHEPETARKKRITQKKDTLKKPSPKPRIANIQPDLNDRSIERERDMKMSDYFYCNPPQTKKDRFDLFFDSVSATVKTLPPKLASEVKSRVSQVIAEFELRAICENEAQVANIVTVELPAGSNANPTNVNQQTAGSTAVTHYVYSYQPKSQE